MRILMLSKACIVGIYQRKLEYIAQHADIDLRVLVPPYWRDERGITPLERVYTQGYDLIETPLRFNGNFHLHYYPQFAKELKQFRPDIVHIDEEPYNLASWLAWRAAQRISAKTLFFSWQNIQRTYPPPFNWFERAVLNGVDFALMGTASAAQVWRAKGYHGELAVIPQFGVDEELFVPPVVRPTDQPPQIGYAGRLVAEKGIDTLLKALQPLNNVAWELQIIGGGPERPALEQLATELGMGERVHFKGLVPSVEMPDFYRTLDILVIPSRTRPNWKEQYGRVILEAMASGVAVIGSDSAAIPDVIGSAGLIFPEDDITALTTHLHSLITQPDQRQQLASLGRERVLAQFTQAQVAQQTGDVYRQLMHD